MAGPAAEHSGDAALTRPRASVGGRRPGATGFARRLERWAADARIDQAALERSREHWLEEQAAQGATLSGLLADLAERGTMVTIQPTPARRQHGTVRVIGHDFVALETPSGAEVLVTLGSIGIVRTAPTQGVGGLRTVTAALRLAEVLAELAADRERVLIVTQHGADSVSGQLHSVGHDLVVLRTDADLATLVYVALGSVSEVTIN